MTQRPPLAVAALAALVVLAGCTMPFDGDSTASPEDGSTAEPTAETPAVTTTGTDRPTTPDGTRATGVGESDTVRVEGELPVNATRVYRRVELLMDVNDTAPTVHVVESDRPVTSLAPDETERALGFGNSSGDIRQCGPIPRARATGDAVRIDPGNLSSEAVELVLAHEFAHTLQQRVDGYENATGGSGLVLREGSAVYVAESYSRRYDSRFADRRPLELRECLYRQAENQVRQLAGQYYFSGRYFSQRIDSPAALSDVSRSPPRTSEQLIHGETPATEPETPLSVTVRARESGDRARQRVSKRQGGELLVRTWLATELPESTVSTAATGWGNDTLLVSSAADRETGVAWVLRWDTETDADEFVTAVAELETERAQDGTDVRAVRVSAATVVVFAGPAPWVADATASGSDGNVTVSPP